MINTNFGKVNNGQLFFLRLPIVLEKEIEIDGTIHPTGSNLYTDREEVLFQLGYKFMRLTTTPQKDGYTYVCTWKETDTEIVQTWIEEKLPDNPYEIIDTLTGEI